MDGNNRWDIRDGILALGDEIFKERNKEAVSNACPKEELKRIVQDAKTLASTTQNKVTKKASAALKLMKDNNVEHSDFYRGFTTFFKDVLSAWAGGGDIIAYVFSGLLLMNFVPELIINMVFSPAGYRILRAVHNKF
jgi:hypothetical protein